MTQVEATSRRDEVVELRKAGLTYAEIGEKMGGISRQAVWYIEKGKPPHKPPHKVELDPKVMLTPGEVALLLGIHINTVRRWNNMGILKSYRINPRGDRRFRREDVDGFLRERRE